MANRTRAAACVALLGALSGCASIPGQVAGYAVADRSIELGDVPFFPQERYQCGPAALTTILRASGSDVSLDDVVHQSYLPGRLGSLQVELVATARASDRIPYVIDGSLASIQRELLAGRPVLVLQNLGVSWYPRWHYAVVVGLDPLADDVILRSGTERRRTTHRMTFMRTWRRGGYWAIVALKPGELPADPDRERYFDAVSTMESIGQHRAALAGWDAALARWPAAPIALFGKGNAQYNLGDTAAAETSYRRLLEMAPDMHTARHNLAQLLFERGERAQAIASIEYILERVDDHDPFRPVYEKSLAEFRSAEAP